MVKSISCNLNDRKETSSNVSSIIQKWSLECACHMIFAKSFGYLKDQVNDSDALRLLDALIGATEAIQTCENGIQFWRIMNVPSWKRLVENMKTIDE